MSSQSSRLYYTDSYRKAFRAKVVDTGVDGRSVVLDHTAFYPTSGGQPHDLGHIAGIPVQEVIDAEDRIIHVLFEPLSELDVDCAIDWPRRFDHMQQHTGQHLLSAVFDELFGYPTVSFHMGALSSTIDLHCPGLTLEQMEAAENRANEIVQENRPVSITVEDSATVTGLRKATDRSGPVRVVAIDGLDRSACGGTHVQLTGEIGAVFIRSLEKIRGNLRLEFLCGSRAIRRARADYNGLDKAARLLSANLDEVPSLIASQAEKLKQVDRARRTLETELAEYRGRALHAETPPNASGIRLHTRVRPEGPFPEDLRPEASAFAAAGMAAFVAVTENPPAVLLATSPDSGIHAGNVLKRLFSEMGGRGGGSSQMAQGSFSADTSAVIEKLRSALSARE